MGLISVLVAAVAAYAFGAVWYMMLAKHWVAASGVETDENGRPKGGVTPYIVAFVGALVTAGMMRHAFSLSGIDDPGKGFMAGLGIGSFLVVPWISANYFFAGRPRTLLLIDGFNNTPFKSAVIILWQRTSVNSGWPSTSTVQVYRSSLNATTLPTIIGNGLSRSIIRCMVVNKLIVVCLILWFVASRR